MTFYISSRGSTATAWISAQISRHPEAVCWHGTRSVPPLPSGQHDLDPKDFVRALLICSEATRHQKTFGACHGFYGLTLKDPVESVGGRFVAITREPVKRIHSQFYTKIWGQITNNQLPAGYKGNYSALIKSFNKLGLDERLLEIFTDFFQKIMVF